MIAEVELFVKSAALKSPIALIATGQEYALSVGVLARFQIEMRNIMARGYCLNCKKWVDKILRRGKYICSECGGDKFVP